MTKNWYPIINYATCTECGACIRQCSHGVFDKTSPQKPLVVFAEGCIDKCHGCGDLCPSGSITYFGDNTGWLPRFAQSASSPTACCETTAASSSPTACCETTAASSSPADTASGAFAGLGSTTHRMQIFEPEMCCETGICGADVDPELIRVAAVLERLRDSGVIVNRFNLSSALERFFRTAQINERLHDEGLESLPLVLLDGRIVISKRYPSNSEFAGLLGLPKTLLDNLELDTAAEGCCCSNPAEDESCCGCDDPEVTM